jgi:hypothetical protein
MPQHIIEYLPVSVVIPTLGYDCLHDTISHLNCDRIKPFEILICIPNDLIARVQNFEYPNVKIIPTSHYGQVYQRSVGFKSACQKFVLQLDDDLNLEISQLKILLQQLIKLGDKNCIGPQMFDIKINKFRYLEQLGRPKWESYIIEFLIGGAKWGPSRMGTISFSGKAYGVDINYMTSENKETEWLAGGCILHYKDNLVFDNFYPFQGKAYSEDLIHSIILRNNGIKLWITKSAICKLEVINDENIQSLDQVNKFVIKSMNKNLFYFYSSKFYWEFRSKLLLQFNKIVTFYNNI